jgi:hypothetical protein
LETELERQPRGLDDESIQSQVFSGRLLQITFITHLCKADQFFLKKILVVQPLHCKKRLAIFPSPAGMSQTKLFLAANNLAGEGKIANLFYNVNSTSANSLDVLLVSPCQLKKLELSKPAKFVRKIYEGFTRRRMNGFCESINVLSS